MENIQLPSVSKTKRLPALGIVTALMVISGSAFAEEGGLAEGATGAITGGSGTLKTVGIAIITVVAGVWVIKRVLGLIR